MKIMSSSGPSKKSGRSGGQSKSKKSANNATPLFSLADQPEFLVEKITGKRFRNGRPQVRIKWQGYPADKSTWEPMENIGNCMVLLANFEAKLFRRREREKKLRRLLPQNRAKKVNKVSGGTQATSTAQQPEDLSRKPPAPVGGRRAIGKSTGPKANAIGNYKKKRPIEQRPTSPLQYSESSDDEDQAEPSDEEMISNDSSSGSSSPSYVSNGSSTENFH